MAVLYDLYGPKNAPTDPNAKNYMQTNLDVWNAFNADPTAIDANAFAQTHYANYGSKPSENRTWGDASPTTTVNSGGGGGGGSTVAPSQNLFQPDLYQKSYSGMGEGYQKDLMETLLPRLKDSFKNYRSDIDQSTKAAQEGFTSMNKRAMSSELQDILNNLSARGMMKSSVASDTISKGMTDLTSKNSDKYFQAAMQNAILKAEEPTLLAKIASLGSFSQSSDPLEPYKLMAQYDWSMS